MYFLERLGWGGGGRLGRGEGMPSGARPVWPGRSRATPASTIYFKCASLQCKERFPFSNTSSNGLGFSPTDGCCILPSGRRSEWDLWVLLDERRKEERRAWTSVGRK